MWCFLHHLFFLYYALGLFLGQGCRPFFDFDNARGVCQGEMTTSSSSALPFVIIGMNDDHFVGKEPGNRWFQSKLEKLG